MVSLVLNILLIPNYYLDLKNNPKSLRHPLKAKSNKSTIQKAELKSSLEDLSKQIDTTISNLDALRLDKGKENKSNNSAKSSQAYFSDKTAHIYDSQRKTFKGDTYSQMKQKIIAKVKPIYHPEVGDERCVVEYADGHHENMLLKETQRWVKLDYARNVQKSKSFEQYRRILVDFLTYCHSVCKINDDKTLFLAVQFLDRFLDKVKVPNKNLQLVGCA